MGLLFWVLMILWLVFEFLHASGSGWTSWGGNALEFVLFGLLGWKCFGRPIQG
jgi:hypothetical protein